MFASHFEHHKESATKFFKQQQQQKESTISRLGPLKLGGATNGKSIPNPATLRESIKRKSSIPSSDSSSSSTTTTTTLDSQKSKANDFLRAKLTNLNRFRTEYNCLQRSLSKLVHVTKSKCSANSRPDASISKSFRSSSCKAPVSTPLKRVRSLQPNARSRWEAPTTPTAEKRTQRSFSFRQSDGRHQLKADTANNTRQHVRVDSIKLPMAAGFQSRGKPKESAKTMLSNIMQQSRQQSRTNRSFCLDRLKSSLIPNLAKSEQVQKYQRDQKRKSKSGSSSRASGIVNLLSAAAASRRQHQRYSPNNLCAALNNGSNLLVVLLINLVLLLALDSSNTMAAPISQFMHATGRDIQPIWLHDGLLTISDANSLDLNPNQPAANPTTQFESPLQEDDNEFEQRSQQRAIDEVDLIDRQIEPRPAQSVHWVAEPKRSWLTLSSRNDPLMSPMRTGEVAVPSTRPNEFFWIERRRLNRDRALEPVAWLRDRPIRRDQLRAHSEQQLVDYSDDQHLTSNQLRQQELDDVNRPIRQRFVRGRQLRQSKVDFYDEVLKHLMEEALEGSTIIDDLYQDVEASSNRPRQFNVNNKERKLNGAGTSMLRQDQNGKLLADEEQLGGGPIDGQIGDHLKEASSNQDSAGDQSLVVAGDEISDNDDVTVLDLPQLVQHQPGQEHHHQQHLTPILAVAQKLTQMPMEKLRQQSGDFVRLPSNGNLKFDSVKKELDNGVAGKTLNQGNVDIGSSSIPWRSVTNGNSENDGDNNDRSTSDNLEGAGLIDLIQNANDQQSEPTNHYLPAEEKSFHVIEDIDQVDSGQEIPLQQADTGPIIASQRNNLAGQQTVQFIDQPELAAKQKREIETEVEDEVLLELPIKSNQSDDDEDKDNDNDNNDNNQEPAGSLIGSDNLEAREERSKIALSGTGNESVNNEKSKDTSMTIDSLLIPTAVDMIQAGFFSRAQLIRFANKLRVYLENTLQLPPGAILGLFPINTKQLLVEIDLLKLSSTDRLNLSQNFGYVRDSSSLVLNWPSGLDNRKDIDVGENPLPVLIAILNELYDDEPNGEQVQKQKKQARVATAGDQINEPVELRDVEVLVQATQPMPQFVLNSNKPASSSFGPARFWSKQEQSTRPQLASLVPGKMARRLEVQLTRPTDNLQELPLDFSAPTSDLMPLSEAWNPSVGLYNEFVAAQQPRLALTPSIWNNYLAPISADEMAPDPSELLMALAAIRQQQSSLSARKQLIANLKLLNGLELQPISSFNDSALALTRDSTNFLSWSTTWLILAMLFALASTCLVVKLIVLKLDKRTKPYIYATRRDTDASDADLYPRWNSVNFWPFGKASKRPMNDDDQEDDINQLESASATIKGKTALGATSGKPLNEPSMRRTELANSCTLSADSGHETIATLEGGANSTADSSGKGLRNSFDSLSQRFVRLTTGLKSNKGKQRSDAPSSLDAELGESGSKNDENIGEPECGVEPSMNEKGNFRSSTSYIKSLIDAITNATSSQQQQQMSTIATSNQTGPDDDESSPDTSGELKSTPSTSSTSSSSCLMQSRQKFQDQAESDEVLMSQMDISAAHLILDYMEKHLIDKERLRREWLELNGSGSQQKQQIGSEEHKEVDLNSKRVNQLALKRLAKVALTEENLAKNRDPSIVPFDRNRVRLNSCCSLSGNSGVACLTNQSGGRQRNGRATRAAGNEQQTKRDSPADYINASFIYDDDPRRPTHILAQGPTEQTCGQFWQMIWEQEISIIVMLSRLNENGKQMCHCYWPTNVAPAGSSVIEPAAPVAGNSTGANRRGSVTSVYSGAKQHAASAATAACNHRVSNATAPIVASGDLSDNVLYFDIPTFNSQDERSGQDKTKVAPTNRVRLEVHLISEHVSSSDYLVRNMYLINATTGETRTISQFHYLAWPASRTAENVRSFLQFRRKVHKSYRNLKSPILVHCNDGAGRSGTYALIDIILERIKRGAKEIDLGATLEHLRDQRVGLCENQAQFEFVLVALAEEIHIILNALPQ